MNGVLQISCINFGKPLWKNNHYGNLLTLASCSAVAEVCTL